MSAPAADGPVVLALEYIERIKPKRAFLTHLNHDILYERDSRLLPENVQFAYDGLIVE